MSEITQQAKKIFEAEVALSGTRAAVEKLFLDLAEATTQTVATKDGQTRIVTTISIKGDLDTEYTGAAAALRRDHQEMVTRALLYRVQLVQALAQVVGLAKLLL